MGLFELFVKSYLGCVLQPLVYFILLDDYFWWLVDNGDKIELILKTVIINLCVNGFEFMLLW